MKIQIINSIFNKVSSLEESALRSIYDLDSDINEIITLMDELVEELGNDIPKNPDEITRISEIRKSLEHTKRQELQLAHWAYSKSRKKGAAKKRESEYHDALSDAIQQFKQDLITLN